MPKEKNCYLEVVEEYAKTALSCAQAYRSVATDAKYKNKDLTRQRDIIKEPLATLMAFYTVGTTPQFADDKVMTDEAGNRIKKLKEEYMNSPLFNNMIDSCTPDELVSLVGKPKFRNPESDSYDIVWEPGTPNQVMDQFAGTAKEMDSKKARFTELVGKLEQSTHKSFVGRLKSFFVGNSKEYETALKAMKGLRDGTISNEQAKKDIKAYLNLRGNKVRDHQYGRDRFDALMSGLSTIMEPKEFKAYCGEIDEMRREKSNNKYKMKTEPDAFKTRGQAARDHDLLADESRMRDAMKDRETQEKQRDEDYWKLKQLVQFGIRKQFGMMKNGIVDREMGNTLNEDRKASMEFYLQRNPSVREEAKRIVDQFKLDIKVPPVRRVPPELKQEWQLNGKPEERPGGPEDRVMKEAAQRAHERDNGGPQLAK